MADNQPRCDRAGSRPFPGGAAVARSPAAAGGQAMRVAAVWFAVLAALASGTAPAQTQDNGDAIEKLRACSVLAPAERLECLDKLSRDIGSPPATAKPPTPTDAGPAAANWIVSETTSPFDYSAIAIANPNANDGPGNATLTLLI